MPREELLYRRIAETIAGSIRAGALVRGERVPSVREMARRHGVAASTIVQAYRWLEDARLLEARPRSGYFVAQRPLRLPEPETSRPPDSSQAVDVSTLVEQVMRLAVADDHVSFGAACPGADLFAEDRVRRALARAVQRQRATLCRYPIGPGSEVLRRAIARHALGLGCRFDPREVIITNSCLESISLALRTVTQPGDVVALESPTYFGFLEILQSLQLRALEIPTHPRHGLSLDALQLAFDTQPVKAVLAVPTLSNPLGATMPQPERRRLARMVATRGIPLIEDVLYNDLAEADDARRSVRAHDESGHVIVCGSFSKTVAPGIRLGWVEGGRWGERLARLRLANHGGQTAVLEHAMADLLSQPGSEAARRQLRGTVAARVDEARGIVAASFPKGTRVTDPPGGFILWVELPGGLDALALFRACLAERIVIAPGTMFSATGRYDHCVRLGVGGLWNDASRRGLHRVGEIACAMLARRSPLRQAA